MNLAPIDVIAMWFFGMAFIVGLGVIGVIAFLGVFGDWREGVR